MFNNNPMNPLQRPKVHFKTNRLGKRKTKRYKVYWSRSTPSSGGYSRLRIKPKNPGQTLYLWLGNGGDNTNFSGGRSIPAPTNYGGASGVGTLSNYSSNLWVCPQGDLSQVGAAFNSVAVGQGAHAVGYRNGDYDTSLWLDFQVIANPTPVNGAWTAIYDSYNTPGSVRTASAYNGIVGGPGSSGYNDYAQNYASYPAIGGYIKVTIV